MQVKHWFNNVRQQLSYALWLIVILVLIGTPAFAVSSEPVRFVFIADIQGRVPLVPPAVLTEHIANINGGNSELVIIGGDLFAGYSSTADILRKEWVVFDGIKSRFNAPVLPVIGNHDVSGAMALGVWREEFPQYNPYYSYKLKDVVFIILNSEENYDKNSISPEQIRWLKSALETASAGKARAIILSMHKPLWQYMKDWQAEVEPLLVKHKVRYVLAGHDHSYYLEHKNGIKYVVAGGGGGWLEYQENPALGSMYHFLQFQLDSRDNIEMQVVNRQNERFSETCVTREQQRYLLPLYRSSTKVIKRVNEQGEQSLIFNISNPHNTSVDVEISFEENPYWVDLNRKYTAKVDAKGSWELAVPLKPRSLMAQLNEPRCTVKITENYNGTPQSVFVYSAE